MAQAAPLLDLAEQPVDMGLCGVGAVHQPDLVGPAAVEGVAPVLDGVAEAVVAGSTCRSGCQDAADDQIGRRNPQHADRARLVVVVVDLGRIVGVDVAGAGVLQDGVVEIGPDRDLVLAALDIARQLRLDRAQVVFANGEMAGVGDLADLDVALARVGAGFVDAEPDAVGPAVGAGGIAPGGGRALVADLVVHSEAGAVDGLVGRHDIADNEVGKGHGIDVQALGAGVIGLVGVLVDADAAIGHHDQVGVAAVADRDVDVVQRRAVALAGVERSAAVNLGKQDIVSADDGVEREVDMVPPLPGRGLGAGIAHGEAQAGAGAGGDGRWHRNGSDAQIGPLVERDDDGLAAGRAVVVAGRAMLVDLRAADAAEPAVGDHAQAVGALDLGGQAKLLGAAVAHPRSQAEAVVEFAEQQRAAIGREQQDTVLPLAGGARHALVEYRPAQIDKGALLCVGGCGQLLDDQVGRRAEHNRHRQRAAGVVVAEDEFKDAVIRRGLDIQEPVAREALGQLDDDAALVAVAHRHGAEVAGLAQIKTLARAIGVLAEPEAVVPAAGVGDAHAPVGDRPLHRELAAAVGRGRRADRLHPQVGVGDGHHVSGMHSALGVVGLAGVFPHRAGGVGLNEDRAVAAESGR